jgi:predicted ATP-grasp superfamily ATP-dependent carboligase
MSKLLLTDGTHRNALAVLRSAPPSMAVDITSRLPPYRSICGLSRHASRVIRVGRGDDPDRYGRQLLDILRSGTYDHFLPVGLESYLAASKLKAELSREASCLLPDWKSMEVAFNKDRSMDLARSIGVPTPVTLDIEKEADVHKIASYPVVIKSSEPGSVRYCHNLQEAERALRELTAASRSRIIAQEMITGHGCGFYAVYQDGQLMDFFLHRRIREFPVTGGASAVAGSYRSRRMFELGKAMGDALEWTGPLMVEFKHDRRSGDYSLMEINPKLWGSLDLTLAAGVDVPGLIIGLADGTVQRPIASRYEDAHYRDVRFRWPFPDQFEVLCSRPSWEGARELLFDRGKSNLALNDPIPDLFMIGTGIVEGLRVLVNERKRYPHGRRPDV